MKQENVQKLLSLVSNWVKCTAEEKEPSYALEEIVTFLPEVAKQTMLPISEEMKSRMYHNTVMALNGGSDEAMKCAFLIRLKALASGDDELVEKIEYLWDVI